MDAVNNRRRFLVGILLGLLAGCALLTFVLQQWRSGLRYQQASRSAIVVAQSLADVVTQAKAGGADLQPIVVAFAKANQLVTARVIQGVKLEASTMPQDTGDKAAPRRLSRDEKYIYDQGQRLRAAVLTNQEEGSARKSEIEIEQLSSGGLKISTPVEADGAVTGFVQIETAAAANPTSNNLLVPALFVVVPLILFALISIPLKDKKMVLGLVALALMAIALGLFTVQIKKMLETDLRAQDLAVSRIVQQQVARTQQSLSSLGIATKPVDSSKWDVDVYRHSYGLLTAQGAVNEQKVKEQAAAQTSELNSAFYGIGALALLITAFFGFGGAAKLWNTFVQFRQAYAYTAPAMIGMLVLVFFPFLYGITLSFTDSSLYNSDKPLNEIWSGIRNYKDILGDFSVVRKTDTGSVVNYQNFYWTLFFTVVWTVSNVTIGVTLGLILALILNTRGLAFRPLYRVLLIFPWAMPNYITALIWKGMFHQQFGVVNQMLQIIGVDPISWFQRPTTSFFTALATNGWLSFPFMMVVSLGALQSIPADLYEAARVDGATRWQQFKSITLPSLRPALVPAIILSVVWTFNMFNIIFLVTAGEPGGATEILITQAYKIAFEKYRYGYAAAYSTVIFLILLIYGTFQNKVTKATEAIT